MPSISKISYLNERLRLGGSVFWLFQGGGWLAFAVAMSLSRLGRFPMDYMVVNKGTLTVLGFLCSLALWRIYRRMWLRSPSLLRIIVMSVLSSYALSLLWTVMFNLAMTQYHAWLRDIPFEIERWYALFSGSVYHSFVLVAWSVLYFGIRYYHDLQAERERTLKAEAQAHRAILRALRYQLNPHFLFNTLNAISTLVVEGQNQSASTMISRLSDFLRVTLDGSDEQEVPLAEELEFARRYLEIEQVRFGQRLQIKFDVDTEVLSAMVPTLVLQPLVENAVRHAIAPKEEGGTLKIIGQRAGGHLSLRVQDDGFGFSGDEDKLLNRGIGLSNTRARLLEQYGEEHQFELQRLDGGGLSVNLTIPFIRQQEAQVIGVPRQSVQAKKKESWPE